MTTSELNERYSFVEGDNRVNFNNWQKFFEQIILHGHNILEHSKKNQKIVAAKGGSLGILRIYIEDEQKLYIVKIEKNNDSIQHTFEVLGSSVDVTDMIDTLNKQRTYFETNYPSLSTICLFKLDGYIFDIQKTFESNLDLKYFDIKGNIVKGFKNTFTDTFKICRYGIQLEIDKETYEQLEKTIDQLRDLGKMDYSLLLGISYEDVVFKIEGKEMPIEYSEVFFDRLFNYDENSELSETQIDDHDKDDEISINNDNINIWTIAPETLDIENTYLNMLDSYESKFNLYNKHIPELLYINPIRCIFKINVSNIFVIDWHQTYGKKKKLQKRIPINSQCKININNEELYQNKQCHICGDSSCSPEYYANRLKYFLKIVYVSPEGTTLRNTKCVNRFFCSKCINCDNCDEDCNPDSQGGKRTKRKYTKKNRRTYKKRISKRKKNRRNKSKRRRRKSLK